MNKIKQRFSTLKVRFLIVFSLYVLTLIWNRLDLIAFPIALFLTLVMGLVVYYNHLIFSEYEGDYKILFIINYILYFSSLTMLGLNIIELSRATYIATAISMTIFLIVVLVYFFTKKKELKDELKKMLAELYLLLCLIYLVASSFEEGFFD